MAKVTINDKEKPINWFVFKSKMFKDLVEIPWLVDVEFESTKLFYSYVFSGFDPEVWELKNGNKVLIKGKPYKEYIIKNRY